MSLRDDLIPVFDETRTLIDDLGMRRHEVVVQTRVWSGGRVGSGTATDTNVTLTPPPKIVDPLARLVSDTVGRYEAGDLIVSKISATYTAAQLAHPDTAGTERIWLVGDRQYKLVGVPEERNFEWRVLLRRMSRPA